MKEDQRGFVKMECEGKVVCVRRENGREGERRDRVQRGEAGGREGRRGSAVKDAWSLLE